MSRNFNEKDDKELKSKNPKLTQWERYRHLPPLKEKNRAFRNLGNLKFVCKAEPATARSFPEANTVRYS